MDLKIIVMTFMFICMLGFAWVLKFVLAKEVQSPKKKKTNIEHSVK